MFIRMYCRHVVEKGFHAVNQAEMRARERREGKGGLCFRADLRAFSARECLWYSRDDLDYVTIILTNLYQGLLTI